MELFKVDQSIINGYKGMRYSSYENDKGAYVYHFYDTPLGNLSIVSDSDYTHHINVFMILLEFEGESDNSSLFWHNQNCEIQQFRKLIDITTHNEYMKVEFPKTTEYLVEREKSKLNELIEHTNYWTKD